MSRFQETREGCIIMPNPEAASLEGTLKPVDLSKHSSAIVPAIQNIVSTVNLDCKLDLKNIALQAGTNAEYNPEIFAAVIMRIREPKTTALIYDSGKMVCTGAKSEQQSKLAARKYARIIRELGFPAMFKGFKIQNMVSFKIQAVVHKRKTQDIFLHADHRIRAGQPPNRAALKLDIDRRQL